MATGISLAVLARNEEQRLANCIKSALPVVDDIVVLDTGSEDQTADVARQLGAQVFHYTWDDDFAAARNRLIAHCTGRWILMLDADEVLINPDHEWWNHSSNLEKADAWWCHIENEYAAGNETTSYHHRLPRLFRNTEHLRYQYPVHENLTLKGATTAEAPVRIKHYGYNAALFDQQSKKDRNLRLLNKRYEAFPDDAHTPYYFAQHYAKNGDPERSFQNALKALQLGIDGSARLMCLRICWRYVIRCNRPDELDTVRSMSPAHEVFPERWVFEAILFQSSEPQKSKDFLGKFFQALEEIRHKEMLHRTDTILPETHREALQLHLHLEIATITRQETEYILEVIRKLGDLDIAFLLNVLKSAIKAENHPVISVVLTYLSQSDQVDSSKVNALLRNLQNYRTQPSQTP